MRENENPRETLKPLRAGFVCFFFNEKSLVEFDYIDFGLKGP